MKARGKTIFSRYLEALGVPYTPVFADGKFTAMTFKSLFGLSHILKDYVVENEGLRISDKTEFSKLTPPFLAQNRSGIFSIVHSIDPVAGTVAYDERGVPHTASLADYTDNWNGIVLLAFPDKNSREPGYMQHRISDIARTMSRYVLVIAALCVFIYFFITRGVYAHVSTVLITVFDLAGLYLSYLLLQKSLNIHTAAGDKVCGILQKGGCDDIMAMSVSKLFGVFSWSEVGFGYFGVSLVTLLLFPHLWPSLAVCNLCCLPYTFWSIWYQRFRAHRWCTLCVGVQSTLWLLFFCYLGGGWFHGALPLRLDFFILAGVYIFSVLFLNLILGIFKNLPCHAENQDNS